MGQGLRKITPTQTRASPLLARIRALQTDEQTDLTIKKFIKTPFLNFSGGLFLCKLAIYLSKSRLVSEDLGSDERDRLE